MVRMKSFVGHGQEVDHIPESAGIRDQGRHVYVLDPGPEGRVPVPGQDP